MHNPLNIPGLKKVTFKRKLKEDLLFFIAAIVLPSSFFNFLPKEIFIDLRLLYLLVGCIYLLFNIKNYHKLLKIKGFKWLLFLVFFVVFRFVYSIVVQDIAAVEVLTIFRTNFCYPIITCGFLLYAVKMDNNRIFRFFYWLFLVTLITGAIYILSNLTGINFYANVAKDYDVYNDAVIMQNMQSIPIYSKFLFVFGIIAAIVLSGFKKYYFILVPILVTTLSIVRSDLIVYFALLLFILLLLQTSRFKIKGGNFFKFLTVGVIATGIVISIFSSHIGRVINKFGFDEDREIRSERYIEKGTYKVRLNMIEEANKNILKNPILGNGYEREVKKGERSFVVGGDTLIAPIIYTEGYLGLILRILPILFFLILGIKHLRSKYIFTSFISIVFVSIILAESLNIVQTRIFVYYNEIFFMFFLLAIINHNNKAQLSTNVIS